MTEQERVHSGIAPLNMERTGSDPVGMSSNSCGNKAWAFIERWRIGDWIVVGVVLIIYGILTHVPVHRQFFDPYDAAIQYPVETQTIPDALCAVIGLVIPAVIIILIAIANHKAVYAKAQCATAIFGLILSFALTMVIIEGLKRAIGQPRPNFIYYSQYDATTGQYGAEDYYVEDAFMSFPSGHSGLSFGCLGYFSLYLLYLAFPAPFVLRIQKSPLVDPTQRNQLWKVVIAVLPIIVAFFIACTRVREYFHHTQDILAGAFIGLCCAYVSFTYNFYQITTDQPQEHHAI